MAVHSGPRHHRRSHRCCPRHGAIAMLAAQRCHLRRNGLLNHKYNSCVLNVMDDPKEFNIISEIKEGLYYIETENYFPSHVNGWVYHYLIAHCLDHSIIQ
jgi:hypothetical protein